MASTSQAPGDHRRKWDLVEYARKAQERLATERGEVGREFCTTAPRILDTVGEHERRSKR